MSKVFCTKYFLSWVVLGFLWCQSTVWAQPGDYIGAGSGHQSTTDTSQNQSKRLDPKKFRVFHFKESSLAADTSLYQKVDSQLLGFQQHTLLYKNQEAYVNLGVAGSPTRSVVYNNPSFKSINLGWNTYNLYQYQPTQVDYWKTNIAFTEATLFLGSQQSTQDNELLIRLLHTQNINRYWNIGFEMQQTGAKGFYNNQQARSNALNAFTSITVPSNKYRLYLNYLNNRHSNQENGGIQRELRSVGQTVRSSEPTFLANSSATSSLKNQNLYLAHYYNPSGDSLGGSFELYHQYHYSKTGFRYTDNGSSFYANNYLSTNQTNDTTGVRQWRNTFGIRSAKTQNPFFWQVQASHTALKGRSLGYLQGNLRSLDTAFVRSNLVDVSAVANKLWGNDLRTESSLDVSLLGLNKGSWQATTGVYYAPIASSQSSLYASVVLGSYAPSYLMRAYQSNYFKWQNDFQNEQIQRVSLGFNHRLIQGFVRYNHLKNYLYFNEDALPQQAPEAFNLWQAGFKAHLTFWRHLHWVSNTTFQYATKSEYIHVPAVWTSNTVFFEQQFKAGWTLQIGTDTRYNTLYQSDAFMPATGQFFLQTKFQAGNYVVVDPFLNIQVKTVRICFKMENANNGFPYYANYGTAYYPNVDRAFRFGVNWKFYN